MINKFEYISTSKKDFDLPTRSTKYSAGYDFHSPISFTLWPKQSICISLEVKCQIKRDEFLLIPPRSSIGFNHFITLWNTIGIIDSDYYNNSKNEGVINLKIKNNSWHRVHINKNDRLVQGIFLKFDTVENDQTENIRSGGLGSTGK